MDLADIEASSATAINFGPLAGGEQQFQSVEDILKYIHAQSSKWAILAQTSWANNAAYKNLVDDAQNSWYQTRLDVEESPNLEFARSAVYFSAIRYAPIATDSSAGQAIIQIASQQGAEEAISAVRFLRFQSPLPNQINHVWRTRLEEA